MEHKNYLQALRQMLRKDTQIYVLLDQSSCTGRIWKEILLLKQATGGQAQIKGP